MYNKIYATVKEIIAINTHSHHQWDGFYDDFDLDKLLTHSYVSWAGVEFGEDAKSRIEYLGKVKYKSYFVWLNKAIKELYSLSEDLSSDNWETYSKIIKNAYGDKDWRKSILKDKCKYDKIILDAYWKPGSDNDDNELFVATFRIDPLLYGFDKNMKTMDGTNLFTLYNAEFDTLKEYETFVMELIDNKIANGAVSLKNADAYNRGINYKKRSKEEAEVAFSHKGDYTKEDIKIIQDYMFFKICALAAKLDVPIQVHTGLGCLEDTRAINLLEVIKGNPDTKFVLFHGSFPWTDDVLALLHACENVYADLCWLPILSPTKAKAAMHEFLEAATLDKLCWGCDTWTPEESYGARLAFNHVLSKVLMEKIQDGYLTFKDVEYIARSILYTNPQKLFKIE